MKLPRVPVADNQVGVDTPVYRDLWKHIGKRMPKKGAGKSGDIDPEAVDVFDAVEKEFIEIREKWFPAKTPQPQ